MVNVHCLNNIASVGLDLFSDDYNMESSYEDAQAVLVRSAKMHDMELNDHLLAIARAGAGVNNIPLDKCAEAGIVVFNTPGANANAVKEQVLAAMLLASRDLIGGNQWVAENKDNADIAKATEKAKKAFAGQELKGKKLGVIGLEMNLATELQHLLVFFQKRMICQPPLGVLFPRPRVAEVDIQEINFVVREKFVNAVCVQRHEKDVFKAHLHRAFHRQNQCVRHLLDGNQQNIGLCCGRLDRELPFSAADLHPKLPAARHQAPPVSPQRLRLVDPDRLTRGHARG